MNLTEAIIQEAFDLNELSERVLKVLRDSIDPIFSVRLCLDNLLLLVVLEGDVELEAHLLKESSLHDRIS